MSETVIAVESASEHVGNALQILSFLDWEDIRPAYVDHALERLHRARTFLSPREIADRGERMSREVAIEALNDAFGVLATVREPRNPVGRDALSAVRVRVCAAIKAATRWNLIPTGLAHAC